MFRLTAVIFRQPPHKTKQEEQPPHKQKAETYRSTSGQHPPTPHSNGELQKQKNNGHNKLYTVLSCLGVFTFCTCCKILICLLCIVASFKLTCVYCCSCLVCIVVSCLVCIVVVLCVLLLVVLSVLL